MCNWPESNSCVGPVGCLGLSNFRVGQYIFDLGVKYCVGLKFGFGVTSLGSHLELRIH